MSKQTIRSRRRNSYGFALMEVMIAAGILGVISLGVVKTIDMTQKSSKKLATDMEVNQIWQRVIDTMRQQNSCKFTLSGFSTAGTNVDQEADSYVAPHNKNAASLIAIHRSEDGVTISPNGTLIQETQNVNRIINAVAPFDAAPFQFGGGTQGRTFVKSIYIVNAGQTGEFVPVGAEGGTITLRAEFQKLSDIPTGRFTTRELEIQVHHVANIIDDCFMDSDSINKSTCEMFGGVYNNDHDATTPDCTDVRLFDGADGGTVGATIGDTTGALPTASLHVTNDTYVASGLDVGVPIANPPAELADGTVRIQTALAIGAGAVAPAGDGAVFIKTSLGVGAVAPAAAGSARFNTAIGVGVAPAATAGSAYFNNSIGVGIAPPAGAGDATINRDLQVNRNFTANGTGRVGSLGVGIAAPAAGNARILTSLGVGVAPTGVAGQIKATSMIITETQDDFSLVPANHAATAGWVRALLTSMLDTKMTPAERQSIVNYLIDSINATNANNGVDLIVDNALSKVAVGSCPANQKISSYTYSINTNTLTPVCLTDIDTDTLCNVNGVCTNVWATSNMLAPRFRLTGNTYGQGYCIAGSTSAANCRTTFRVWPYACTITGLTTVCPVGYFSAGRTPWHRVCCAAKIR